MPSSTRDSNRARRAIPDVALLVVNILIVSWWLGAADRIAWLFAWIALDFMIQGVRRRFETTPRAATVGLTLHLILLALTWGYLKKEIHLLGASYLFLKMTLAARDFSAASPAPGLVRSLNALLFAPSFTAGPVFAPSFFLKQTPVLDGRAIRFGLERLVTGLFKLHVLGAFFDGISPYRGEMPAYPVDLTLEELLIGFYAGGLWIYFNFAGYSDMAIGAAACLGIRLPENFAAPLLATDIASFWRRWHISFTEWLRAMIFDPVTRLTVRLTGGSGLAMRSLPFFATMIVCGPEFGLRTARLGLGVARPTPELSR